MCHPTAPAAEHEQLCECLPTLWPHQTVGLSLPPRFCALHHPDAGAQTVQGFRLSGGASSAEGLLEVRLAGSDGSWGGVCALQQLAAVAAMAAADSSAAFDAHLAMAEAQNAAAEVACGALNLTGGVARVGAGFYTADATRLPAALIDGLACSGSEDGLSACGFSRARACPEGQRLGVSCGGARGLGPGMPLAPRAAKGMVLCGACRKEARSPGIGQRGSCLFLTGGRLDHSASP